MDPITIVLVGVLAPAAVAFVVAWGMSRIGQAPGQGAWWSALAAPVALFAGYALVFELVLGWPALPPVDVTQASPWVGLAAVVVTLGLVRTGSGARIIVSSVAGLGLGLWLVLPLVPHALSPGLAALHVGLVAMTVLMLDRGLARAVGELDPAAGAGAVATVVGGSALAILLSDVASLGQVTGGLAAAAGALAVLGLVSPRGPRALDLRHVGLVVAAIVATNLWSAVLYASGRYEVVALVAVTPLVLVAARSFVTRPRRALVRAALPAIVASVPIALAAGLAARSYLATDVAPSVSEPGQDTVPATKAEGYDPDYGY